MTTRATYTNIDSLGMISRIDGTTTLVSNYEYHIRGLKMISRTPLTQQQIDNLRAAGLVNSCRCRWCEDAINALPIALTVSLIYNHAA